MLGAIPTATVMAASRPAAQTAVRVRAWSEAQREPTADPAWVSSPHSADWDTAAQLSRAVVWLTPQEATALQADIHALIKAYRPRRSTTHRPKGAAEVEVVYSVLRRGPAPASGWTSCTSFPSNRRAAAAARTGSSREAERLSAGADGVVAGVVDNGCGATEQPIKDVTHHGNAYGDMALVLLYAGSLAWRWISCLEEMDRRRSRVSRGA